MHGLCEKLALTELGFGFRLASDILANMMLEHRHKAAMKDLEKKMQLEMARQREELHRELEEELQQELEVRHEFHEAKSVHSLDQRKLVK